MLSQSSNSFIKFAFVCFLLAFLFIGLFGIKFLAIPILISGVQFYLFQGTVNELESRGIPRWITILFIFSIFVVFFYWILAFYLPYLFQKTQPALNEWSTKMNDPTFEILDFSQLPIVSRDPIFWKKILKPEAIAIEFKDFADNFLKETIVLIPTFLSWLVIIPIISFFLLLDANFLYKSSIGIVPNRYFEMTLMIVFRINEQITKYLKSLGMQSGIMAILASIGFWLIGLKFSIAFALFLGLANSIPYIGPLMGAIPPILFSFLFPEINPSMASIAGIVIFAQLFDNIFVQPIVIANAVNLHPLFILLGITVGGQFFGIFGMLLAIPTLSIMKVITSTLYETLQEHKVF